jgi:putative transposase
MITYKIEQKGGLVLMLPTQTLKPSQRCPHCWTVHKEWADLSNRYHVCSCGFAVARNRGSVSVLYNVATNWQPGLGTSLVSLGCLSSTMALPRKLSKTRRHTGSMKQLGQKKRLKSHRPADGETPSVYAVG